MVQSLYVVIIDNKRFLLTTSGQPKQVTGNPKFYYRLDTTIYSARSYDKVDRACITY